MRRKKYRKFQIKFTSSLKLKSSLCCFNIFVACNFFAPALLEIVFFSCRVFEIVKVRSSTLLAELSYRHAFYLVRRLVHRGGGGGGGIGNSIVFPKSF